MTVITYGTDVAPHLKRGLKYRRLRMQRRRVLHAHDHEGVAAHDPYGDVAYDPYGWARIGNRFKVLMNAVAILLIAAGIGIISLFKPNRSGGA